MTFWARPPAPESPLQRRHGDLVEALKIAGRALQAGDVDYASQIIGVAIKTEEIRAAHEADLSRELRSNWDAVLLAAGHGGLERARANDEKKPLGKERLLVQTENTVNHDHTDPATSASTD